MKKNYLFLIVFILLLFAAVYSVQADIYGDFEYTIKNNGSVIEAYHGNEQVVSIPYSFGYFNVTEIASGAFQDNQNIISVTMPGSIETIGDRAFANCTNLQNLILSVGVKSIGTEAFLNCSKIPSVTLPFSLESIGKRAFEGCTNLYYINDLTGINLKKVGSGAFDGTEWFTSKNEDAIFLGQGYILLKYKSNENSPVLPWYVVYIAEDALAGNDNITDLVIPNYVTELQEGSISGMASLTSVTGGASITHIEDGAFRDLPNLEKVKFENIGLTGQKFVNCPKSPYGTDSVSFHDSENDQNIESKFIYEYNDELNGVTIVHCLPDAVNNNGELVIPDYIYNDPVVSIGEGACQNREDIQRLVLPKFLVEINSWAFSFDSNLHDVEFPANLKWIQADAFNSCAITNNVPELSGVNVHPRAFYPAK
ncbi:MAG: leucine-rich repeat protein [Anaerolineaceae bacterium]|nr:leucine-rich repeat protein [Anaerolineaceae bacterium]